MKNTALADGNEITKIIGLKNTWPVDISPELLKTANVDLDNESTGLLSAH